jgi:cation diffusion facilitator CzcD-associated flavoprotein CzcO
MPTNEADSKPQPPQPAKLGFDPDALREKYRVEREKRLRPDGNDQYLEIEGAFRHYGEDPYRDPDFEREPLTDEVDVALIGGGFGGLIAGARLRELGIERIRIIEKGADVGGTWYWNRYPGAACDVESYIYLPLLEELDYVPTEKYSRGPEIFAHAKAIAEKYDLYRDACLQTEVTEMRWDVDISRWIISTNRGDTMKARFICMSNGWLQKPKLPAIPGISTFQGHIFHTSRWDFEYTGGDSEGGLTGLSDKRVGIIGTGATAVQSIPHLARSAEKLFVFQRTPSSIDVRANRPTDPEWANGLEPGWHQRRMDNFHTLTTGGYEPEDLVNDGWTDIVKNMIFVMENEEDADLSPEGIEQKMELADFMKMESIRARVNSIVVDPETAEALKPYYRQFCKRPCFHDEYLQAFNRENVTLVDTQGRGVERITETGVVIAGREYAVDCIVLATGFEVGTDYSRRAGFEVIGRDGTTLTQKWKDGVTTLHGLHIRSFPNAFMMSIAQSGLTLNFPHMINEQAKHIAYVVNAALKRGIDTLEVTEQAETEWVEDVLERAEGRTGFSETCTPGYYNNEGNPGKEAGQNFFFFGEPMEFVETLEAWREDGELAGLERG